MLPFERLGPYVIERALGSGGMGSVFVGVDPRTGQRTAVKVLSPALAADPSFRERFATEVETLKKLKHPNIVQLLGFGEQDGQLFYVMEMVDGRTLQQELQAGRRFPWREVARIGVQICQALKHAHDRGVIHRDLKPANLLYTQEDQVKLVDFGIAKFYGMSQLTVEGGVIGTADFMSPEQGEGKRVTSRSDLYSLGSVLFTLLAGRPPFASRAAAEVIHKLRYEEALPVRRLAPDTPAEFELIIAQLLEKDPDKRIATALAVANRLKAMEYALSLETRIDIGSNDFDLAGDDEYEVAADVDQASKAEMAEKTQLATSAGEVDRDSLQRHRNATVAMSNLATPEPSKSGLEGAPSTHFTTYDEAERRRATALGPPDDNVPVWLKIAPILAAGALIAAAIWYFGRPATAESLYEDIFHVAKQGETSDLTRVETKMDEFLERFAGSDHYDEVRALREELDLYRLQRRYERRAKLRGGSDSLSPVERVYVDATRLAASDREAAIAKLQALLDVFSGPTESKSETQCLRLAREQLQQLKARGTEMSAKDLLVLNARLDLADQFEQTEPSRAAAIRRGIIVLYRDKPWARAAVDRAEKGVAAE